MTNFKFIIFSSLISADITALVTQEINDNNLFIFLALNILSLLLLNEQEKRKGRKAIFRIISWSCISHTEWVWSVRALAGAITLLFGYIIISAFFQGESLLYVAAKVLIASYMFWYLHWIVDGTEPIDRRIIRLYRKNKR